MNVSLAASVRVCTLPLFQFIEVVAPNEDIQDCPAVPFKLPEYGELKEVPDVPAVPLPEEPEVPVDPEDPEDPLVPVDPEVPAVPLEPVVPDVPEVPFINGECPEITSMSNQGYEPVVLKSEFPPNPVTTDPLLVIILNDTTVLPDVVITDSDKPPKVP